jgi:phosphate transport system substrate-binding protein
MSQKNETTVLVLALLMTAALLGGGIWWFTKGSGFNIGGSPQPSPNSPSPASTSNSPPPSTGEGFSQVQNIPSGLFNYGGSTSWAPIRLSVDSAILAARPEFRLRYNQPLSGSPSSGTGIKMLLDGRVAFAQSSRPILDAEYQQAQQRGFTLQQIPIAIDGLAVAVNPNLNISGLTVEQLKSIYTGRVNNWQQVGGPNLPIQPFSRPTGSGGTVELFVEEILAGQAFGANVRFIPTTTDALRRLASNPGGIYYASAPEVVPQCTIKPLPLGRQVGQFVPPYQEPFVPLEQCPGKRNQLNTPAFQSGQYPITRNLFVIVKQNGQTEEQAGKAYANLLLTDRGQELINQAGFVKIR